MQPEVKEQYMKHLRELNISEHVLESYWLEGISEGMEKGREEGRQAQLHLIVKRSVEQGYSISQIANLVGLSEVEVEDLLVRLKLL